MENEIKFDLLKKVFDEIISHLEKELNAEGIAVSEDLYWDIVPQQKYLMTGSPNDFHVGQILDDIEFIKQAIQNEDPSYSAMLCHLCPLINYLNFVINQRPNFDVTAKEF